MTSLDTFSLCQARKVVILIQEYQNVKTAVETTLSNCFIRARIFSRMEGVFVLREEGSETRGDR